MYYTKEWLEKEISKGKKLNYFGFWGMRIETEQEKCMSNFYLSDFTDFTYTGIEHTFKCSEQLFMYRKAIAFKDFEVANQIFELGDKPYECKRLGRSIKNYDENVWSAIRYDVMFNSVYAKFNQNPKLKSFLLETENSIIVETSPYDDVWGIKLSKYLKNGHLDETYAWKNVSAWEGLNLLGFVLMEVRDKLRLKNIEL